MRRRQQNNSSPGAPQLPPPTAIASRDEVDRLNNQLVQLREHLDKVTQAIGAQLNVALDTIDANLRVSRDESARLDEKVDQAVTAMGAHDEALEERITAALTSRSDELTATLDERAAQFTTMLDERSARLTVDQEFKLEQVENRLATRLDDVVSEQRATATALAENVQKVADASGSQIQQTNEVVARLRDDLGSATSSLRHEIEQAVELLSTRQAARSDELRVELASMRTQIEAVKGELADRLGKVAEQATGTAFSLMQLQDRIGEIDAHALDELRERVSSVAGEGALVRIEMDRLTGNIDDRFDRIQLRVNEMESKLESDEDVSLSVQLDRLDELERAIAELDPDRFVTKDELLSPPGSSEVDESQGGSGGHGQGLHIVPGYAEGGW